MAILTRDDIARARKWSTSVVRTGYLDPGRGYWETMMDLAGSLSGTLYAGNTTTGVVPTNLTAGMIPIPPHTDEETVYLVGMGSDNIVGYSPQSELLFDNLWKAGSFNDDSLHTFSDQPSYVDRLPVIDGMTCYAGCEIWITSKSIGSTLLPVAGYTNQDGVDTFTAALTFTTTQYGVAIKLPLAAGDYGVQKVNSIQMNGRAGGDYGIEVNRMLMWSHVEPITGRSCNFGSEITGIIEVPEGAALCRMAVGTNTAPRPTYNRYDFIIG